MQFLNDCQKEKNIHAFSGKENVKYLLILLLGGIEGSLWAHDRFIDDLIIRKFIEGTFYDLLFSDVIVKRTLNQITISIYVQAKGPTVHKVYFLLGFSEKLLSHMLGCVVKMEIMSVQL